MLFTSTDSGFLQGEIHAITDTLAVMRLKFDGTVLSANQNFLELLNYELDEIEGKNHNIFFDPDYPGEMKVNKNWDNLSNGESISHQIQFVTQDGRKIRVEATYVPISKHGKVIHIVGYVRDVTSQTLELANYRGQIEAIGKSQLVIEFDLDGTILSANENFLKAVGYSLDEIQGKHHRIFADPVYAESDAYREFWQKLGRGEFFTGEFQRFGKGNKEIWIQASYNPIKDLSGRPFKVVKYASDVTDQKFKNANFEGQIGAISKSQAVIEFELDGTIITANDNFLNAMEYRLDEVQGRHHRIFVDPEEARSPEYAAFWQRLGEGHFDSSAYKRLKKSGREIWIQATYNPIFDMNGKPFKVVKYANDVTNVIRTAETAESTALNVQNVAASIEEMSVSANQITQNMKSSSESAEDILKATNDSKEKTEQLVETMQKMESISVLINNIAGKINLLALNATIQAARAGEAGKGFAVVASEVKNLAKQTSEAIEKINSEIEYVQATSQSVVQSVDAIQGFATSVSEKVAGTANAVTEQSLVTNDIAARIQDASTSVNQIAQTIRSLSK